MLESAPSFVTTTMAPSIMSPGFPPIGSTNLPKTLLCPSDIDNSISAYETLLQSAKSYRNQLAALSQSANGFGAALEACSRVKGVDEAAEGLSNVAGLQYLVANHQSVLSDTIYRSFEIPLRENLENFIATTEQRREEYKMELKTKMKLLAKREKEHLALAHKKQRSLNKFREALSDLTALADGIEQLKSDYFYNALDYHCETWSRVQVRSNIVCKAELALYSGIAQKSEHLECSLLGTPDPWNQDARCGDEIFHIVPPQDILARPQSPGHGDSAGLFQSLLGAVEFSTASTTQGKDVQAASDRGLETVNFFSAHDGVKDHDENYKKLMGLQRSDIVPETPRMKHVKKLASPYEDAEEAEEQTAQQPKHIEHESLLAKKQKPSSLCTTDTPSRPTTKRYNAQPCQSPNRDRHNSIKQIFTPQPRSVDGGTGTLGRNSGKTMLVAAVDDQLQSPDGDEGQKHSEYCKVKLEPEE